MDTDKHSASEIKRVLQFKNIAVVGMSKNEEKPAYLNKISNGPWV